MAMTEHQHKERSVESQGRAAVGMMAAAVTLLVPGVGHVLIRRWSRGVIWFAGWIVVAVAGGSPYNAAVTLLMGVAAFDAFVLARDHVTEAGNSRDGRG